MTEKDKLAKLYDFLKHDVEVSFLDGDVIDVAMDVISRQIERIKKLEKANKDNYWIASDYKFENLKLEQQNKRYREALEEITSRKMSTFLTTRDMNIHFIKTARKALESESND